MQKLTQNKINLICHAYAVFIKFVFDRHKNEVKLVFKRQ